MTLIWDERPANKPWEESSTLLLGIEQSLKTTFYCFFFPLSHLSDHTSLGAGLASANYRVVNMMAGDARRTTPHLLCPKSTS